MGGLSFAILCAGVPDSEVAAHYGPLPRGPAGTPAVSGLSVYPDSEMRAALGGPPGYLSAGGPCRPAGRRSPWRTATTATTATTANGDHRASRRNGLYRGPIG